MALLDVREVGVRFGGVVALDSLSFTIEQGTICGLIGPNGAGKTTMFNCISRIYRPTSGEITYDGRDLLSIPAHGIAGAGIGRTFQNLALFPRMSVLENVMVGAHARSSVGFLRGALRLGVATEERSLAGRALTLLHALGLGDLALQPCDGLPYGTLKRIEIARAMACEPRLLLMDEPASGLNHSEVAELGATIRRLRDQFGVTVLLVEHHMQLVMGVSDKVVVLDFGRNIATGTPAEVSQDPRVIEAYLGVAAS